MEQLSNMDKKPQSRPTTLPCKGSQDSSKSEFSTKKNGSQYPRKREYDKFDYSKRPPANRGGRTGQRNVRPREKVGCQVDSNNDLSELGSLQRSGSKKQNITHLLNWWGPGPTQRHSNCSSSYMGRKHNNGHVKYNKEHYLQANCQFVVTAGKDYSVYENNPDQLVEWDFVEEVRLHVSEPPACPICLHPPIAAKVTRCGHIYCFSCILHYLALSDKKWRKCPICYDAIIKNDLKSVTTVLHKDFSSGQTIQLQLMRRERDSLIPIPVSAFSPSLAKETATLSNANAMFLYSKLIVATSPEVSKYIVSREIGDLQCQLAIEGDQPEACFIEEALTLVYSRQSLLSSKSINESNAETQELGACGGNILPKFNSIDGMELYKSIQAVAVSFGEMTVDDVENRLEIKSEIPPEVMLATSPDTEVMLATSPDTEVMLGPSPDIKFLDDSALPNESITTETIHPEETRIEHLHPHSTESVQDTRGGPKATTYFYQEISGTHVYLHPLNVHMLVKEYGSFENCPQVIEAKVLEKESASMTDVLRLRLRYLRHLPVSCPFEVVEVELKQPIVSVLTLVEYQGQIEQREKKRKKRAKEEHRIEKRVQVEEDRMMGRSRGTNLNMSSYKHFPTFSEDPPLAICEEEKVSTTFGSPNSSDTFPGTSPPSFAQMIRDGQKIPKMPQRFSSIQGSQQRHYMNYNEPKKGALASEDDDDDEGERVPYCSTTLLSEAVAKALEAASKKVSGDGGSESLSQRGKKGKKKKKGIVLLSSGGR